MVHLNITNKTKSLMTLANVLKNGGRVSLKSDETVSVKKTDLSKTAMNLFRILGDKVHIELGTAVVEVNDNESVEDADDVTEEVNEPAPAETEPQDAPEPETVESVLQEVADEPVPDERPAASESYWHGFYKDELVQICKDLGLDCGGTKSKLVDNLTLSNAVELETEEVNRK